MMKKMFLCLSMLWASLFCFGEEINKHELISLSHVKGFQSVGIRGGHGTKNLFDVGATYTYCFNNRLALLVEVDHERWRSKQWKNHVNTDFVNVIMLSPGVEHIIINPIPWFYWHWGIGAAIGYDKWSSPSLDIKEAAFCYGAQVGTGVEFMIGSRWSIVVKGQQYILFSKVQNYLKPNFSVAARFNFHK